MLIADPAKYFGIVLGIAFASLLISQQSSIFCGLIWLTTSQIRDVDSADIWVMDPAVEYADAIEPMVDNATQRVRGVSGVRWAVPFYKGNSRARLLDGDFQRILLLGIDDSTLIGAPSKMLIGSIESLRRPDAVILDERGFHRMFPDEPLETGKVFEINDRRAVVVGVCQISQTFQSFPVAYCRYSQALRFIPPQRKTLSFVLAQAKPGIDPRDLADRIETETDLKARTQQQFIWDTIGFYLRETGIPVNFGITVLLGFIVGTAVAGQTFYLFTVENLRQFAMLKALGTSRAALISMLLVQSLTVGTIGYGIGLGGAALFGYSVGGTDRLAYLMPWEVAAGTAVAVIMIVLVSSVLCLLKVLRLSPSQVFRT